MTSLSTTSTNPSLDDGAIQALERMMSGSIVEPSSPDYDSVRRVWNGMIDKRPALIARCQSTGDVVAALRFARDHNVPVAVRGNGHNVAGNALCDDGLVIDLSLMKDIQVDPSRRRASVQPGANWGELDRATQAFGLATPGGQVSTTGVSGFTLGGGMGFLRRKWGLACDNLISAEVVTANGEVLTASEAEHPDLFWAIRGGGGNFGVVTSFEFQLHPLGPEISSAIVVYPGHQTLEIALAWRQYLAQAPDEVTCDLLIWGMPPLPDVPPEMHWAPVAIVAAVYAGPVDVGERVLRPVREFGTPVADMSGTMPYVAMQSSLDPLFPNGQHYYWKSLFGTTLSDDVIEAIAATGADRPTPQTLIALRGLGGAMGRVPEGATAYGNRDALFNLSFDATWTDAAESERVIDWTRRTWSTMRDLTGGGTYVNFAGLGEENDLLAHTAYGINFERLTAVKRRYDPTNLFQGNINIAP